MERFIQLAFFGKEQDRKTVTDDRTRSFLPGILPF